MMLEALHRSLTYCKNSRGPKIDPWGTPHVIFKKEVLYIVFSPKGSSQTTQDFYL